MGTRERGGLETSAPKLRCRHSQRPINPRSESVPYKSPAPAEVGTPPWNGEIPFHSLSAL